MYTAKQDIQLIGMFFQTSSNLNDKCIYFPHNLLQIFYIL